METKVRQITRKEVEVMAEQYAGDELVKLANACNDLAPLIAGKRPDAMLASVICATRDSGVSVQSFIAGLVPFVIFIWESMDTSEVKSVGDA